MSSVCLVWSDKKERISFCTSHNSEAQNHFNLGLGPEISNNSNLAGQKICTLFLIRCHLSIMTLQLTRLISFFGFKFHLYFFPSELQRLPVVYQHCGKKSKYGTYKLFIYDESPLKLCSSHERDSQLLKVEMKNDTEIREYKQNTRSFIQSSESFMLTVPAQILTHIFLGFMF